MEEVVEEGHHQGEVEEVGGPLAEEVEVEVELQAIKEVLEEGQQ